MMSEGARRDIQRETEIEIEKLVGVKGNHVCRAE